MGKRRQDSDRPTKEPKKKQARPTGKETSQGLDTLVSNMMSLEDINADPNGASSKSQDKAAREQFIAFLGGGVCFESIPVEIDKPLIGRFCSFMLENQAIGYQTSMNYLSSIRRQLEKTYETLIFKNDSNWYKETRRNLTRSYVLACLKG